MRTSQIALLSAAGAVVAGVFAVTALSRFGLTAAPAAAELDDRVSRNLNLSDFDSLAVQGSWGIEIVRGERWQVELSYPEGLQDDFVAEVRAGRLVLEANGRTAARQWGWFGGHDTSAKARVIMPALARVEIMGTSEMEFRGFDGAALELDVSGAVNVDGHDSRYDRLDLNVSGAGRIGLEGVAVRDADVNLSGASLVVLTLDGGVLSGELSGVGTIIYHGEIQAQRVNVSGFGRVQQAN
jgi:hypothetical protein